MVGAAAGGSLLGTLTDFINLVLHGGVPDDVRPSFFGASLHAFQKKDGGVRPIAVGLTLRRLVAKCANKIALSTCAAISVPRQLGVGAKGGAEALTHAARAYTSNMGEDKVFVKLDFTNAFNTVRRDAVLDAVSLHQPNLLPFVISAYGAPSLLWSGEASISSAEGVQQGDPLGPLLFCLALHDPLQNLKSEFISGYLDDVGLGDSAKTVIQDIAYFEKAAESIGLHLNHAKCEIIGLNGQSRPTWIHSGFSFEERSVEEVTLLGSPLSVKGLDAAISNCREKLQTALPRLNLMSAHEPMTIS
jgi:hypothetical protein